MSKQEIKVLRYISVKGTETKKVSSQKHYINIVEKKLRFDFDFQQIKALEIKKLLKEIDVEKAVGVDTIPPKLIKIGEDIIAEPLTQTINCCLRQGIFPDNARIGSVVPLDKGKPDKYDVLNYRPVRILNAVSKIYKKVIKNQLVSFFLLVFLSFISAYRKSYSTQQVFICLLEEPREIRQESYCGCSFNRSLTTFLTILLLLS